MIREQPFGGSLDPDKLERLGRYEVHLDHKLERTLVMLLRLKISNACPEPGDPFRKMKAIKSPRVLIGGRLSDERARLRVRRTVRVGGGNGPGKPGFGG